MSLSLVKERRPVSVPPDDDPMLQLIDHLQAVLLLLPRIAVARDKRLTADVCAEARRVVREEQERSRAAAEVRGALELPEWLTTAQAAEVLKIERSTIYARLQDERKKSEGERPLTVASRPTGRKRGRGFDREFNRDALLAMTAGEEK